MGLQVDPYSGYSSWTDDDHPTSGVNPIAPSKSYGAKVDKFSRRLKTGSQLGQEAALAQTKARTTAEEASAEKTRLEINSLKGHMSPRDYGPAAIDGIPKESYGTDGNLKGSVQPIQQQSNAPQNDPSEVAGAAKAIQAGKNDQLAASGVDPKTREYIGSSGASPVNGTALNKDMMNAIVRDSMTGQGNAGAGARAYDATSDPSTNVIATPYGVVTGSKENLGSGGLAAISNTPAVQNAVNSLKAGPQGVAQIAPTPQWHATAYANNDVTPTPDQLSPDQSSSPQTPPQSSPSPASTSSYANSDTTLSPDQLSPDQPTGTAAITPTPKPSVGQSVLDAFVPKNDQKAAQWVGSTVKSALMSGTDANSGAKGMIGATSDAPSSTGNPFAANPQPTNLGSPTAANPPSASGGDQAVPSGRSWSQQNGAATIRSLIGTPPPLPSITSTPSTSPLSATVNPTQPSSSPSGTVTPPKQVNQTAMPNGPAALFGSGNKTASSSTSTTSNDEEEAPSSGMASITPRMQKAGAPAF